MGRKAKTPAPVNGTPPPSTGPKLVTLSVREFALPVPRTGHIESNSGYGRATADGLEIHQRVQRLREQTEDGYEAEVTLTHEFEGAPYRFKISGRIDGLFRVTEQTEDESRKVPRIEEIKSAFNVRELVKKLSAAPDDHPYCLQLKTYGYFYWRQNQVMPKLSFHLVSSRNGESVDLEIPLDLPRYELWLKLRLAELVEETRKAEKRAARRRKIAENFAFPFPRPRPGQVELIQEIEDGMKSDRRMLIQAPTGLGKTAGVLYPTLKEALGRGSRVVYVTPKNSQHSVAEDAVERFQDTGAKVKSLTITAKSKICFKNEPLCNPEYCEFARDYYAKVASNGLKDILAKKKKLSARTFRDLGQEYEVCPFELQLEAAEEADTIICDYNYVFAPRSALGRIDQAGIDQVGKPNLVIDEAHNLPARAMDFYSPALSSLALEKMREDVRKLPARFRGECEELLDECIETILSCKPKTDEPEGASVAGGHANGRPRGAFGNRQAGSKIDPPVAPFHDQDAKLRGFLSRYLESDVEIQPKDVVLRLAFYWSEFTSALEFVGNPEHTEFFTTYQPHPQGGTVKITCCDASKMLEACYDDYDQVVGFSATLKPFGYYAKLSGLDPDRLKERLKTAEFRTPFFKANRKLLIIPQISTKYADRERNYPKIAETIERLSALKRGNYFVFFPSFEFLERVLAILKKPPGFTILKQAREMRAPDVQGFLDHLREGAVPTLVFAVQGGVFSEGVDYPGDMIIGAFVIGPPLPNFDLEREEMRRYYDSQYGSGFDYAYTYPAMAKAVQAAGRVIRSETDRGLIVLMDNRFIQPSYTQSMPTDWFEHSARELVSESLIKEVSEFWAEDGLTEEHLT